MPFISVSVKDAMKHINAQNNGWFLPAVQRPYVWGSRYESDKYIYKLFDSILNGYPIGTLIVWNTDLEVPYREFMQNYSNGQTAQLAQKCQWGRKDKWLVYDGQQRLQTLYSCLYYTMNGRTLAYDLRYDPSDDNCGFVFIDQNNAVQKKYPGYVMMPQLFTMTPDARQKVLYRNQLLSALSLTNDEAVLCESRFDRLWSVFAEHDVKPLVYWSLDSSMSEDQVNEIFQRLNIGGVPLSGADLLFAEIKASYPHFEDDMNDISDSIYAGTNGYAFSANEILQFIHLIVKGSTRIDTSRITVSDINEFQRVGNNIKTPLQDFFVRFMLGEFQINNAAIVPRKLALLPLLFYVYKNSANGKTYQQLDHAGMKQYFILSQLNDWNTQGIVEGAARAIMGAADTEFPLCKIEKIAANKKRIVTLTENAFEDNRWFALKVLIPHRVYSPASGKRYKPELDHIFPKKLKNPPTPYQVDTIWNLQPISGQINLQKKNKHPKAFFTDPQTASYFSQYDFLPDQDSTLWDDPGQFIARRKDKMLQFMMQTYGLTVTPTP